MSRFLQIFYAVGAVFLVFSASASASAAASAQGLSSLALPALEAKLQAQWHRYERAQALLLQRAERTDLSPEARLISREQWERVIQADRFSAQDLRMLRLSQRRRILAARERATRESRFNLDLWRALPPAEAERKIASFCASVPKGAMLHVHPGGTFDRATVAGLLQSRNPELNIPGILETISGSEGNSMLYPEEIDGLRALGERPKYLDLDAQAQDFFRAFLFLPPGKQPFARFNAVFAFLGSSTPDFSAYELALRDFARRAVSQGVFYVEFTGGFSPGFVPVLERIERDFGLLVRVNQSFRRLASPANLDAKARALLASPPSPWLVGIDLLDNEEGNPALEKGQLPYGAVLAAVRAGRSRLHRTMHAGEIGDPRDPRDALVLGVDRIGHGVKLHSDVVALEYAARRRVPVEINITSNLRLTEIDRVSEHPFLDYLRLGLPVSLSTDDEGIFDTDINRECELAVTQTDIRYSELRAMAFHSIETSFASQADRLRLHQRLTQAFTDFERGFLPGGER